MPEDTNAEAPKKLEEMVKQQLEWSEKIFKQNKKILSHMRWAAFAGFLKLALFIVPLIIAAIFLPPLINGYLKQYQELLGNVQQGKEQMNSFNLDEVMKQVQEFRR